MKGYAERQAGDNRLAYQSLPSLRDVLSLSSIGFSVPLTEVYA